MRACLGFALGLAVAGCAAAPRPTPLRLERVVLYQNGVGYFEQRGHAAGGRLRLRLARHELDDVLKTLTVVEAKAAGGARAGAVAALLPAAGDGGDGPVELDVRLSRAAANLLVAYTLPAPAWKVAYRLVLGEPGEGGGGAAEGGLLQAWAIVSNSSAQDWTDVDLTLATGAPLSFTVDLHTPEMVGRPDASGRIHRPAATGVVRPERAQAVDRDADGVFDDTDGCPDVPGAAGHARPGEDGCPTDQLVVVSDAQIQILQHVYFAAGSDAISADSGAVLDEIAAVLRDHPELTRVELSGHAAADEPDPWGLSARRAAAVRAALATRGIAGERLPIEAAGASMPIDAGRTDAARARNRRVELRVLATAGEHPRGITASAAAASVAPTAPIDDVAGSARYRVADPVTVPHGASVMVSIVNQRLAAVDVYLYRPDDAAAGSDAHPFRAVRLEAGRLSLEPGPIAVFARGAFVGDALLERLHAGEAAFIPYAVDGSTAVRVAAEGSDRPVRVVAAAAGVMTVEDWAVRTTRYVTEAGADAPVRLYVRHARTPGYEPAELPPGSESTGDALLVPMPILPGRTATLVVEERQSRRRQITMIDASAAELAVYLDGDPASLPAEAAARLRGVVERRQELARLEEERGRLEEELTAQATRAGELRASLAAIAKTAGADALRRQLLARLGESTARSDELARRLAERGEAVSAARAALAAAVTAFTFG